MRITARRFRACISAVPVVTREVGLLECLDIMRRWRFWGINKSDLRIAGPYWFIPIIYHPQLVAKDKAEARVNFLSQAWPRSHELRAQCCHFLKSYSKVLKKFHRSALIQVSELPRKSYSAPTFLTHDLIGTFKGVSSKKNNLITKGIVIKISTIRSLTLLDLPTLDHD